MEVGVIDTRRICACLERLADQVGNSNKKWRPADGDHRIYRIKVTSSEGTRESVIVMLDVGHKRQPDGNVDKIVDQLRIDRGMLDEVVDEWTKERFLEHCATLTAAELKPPAMRRGAPGAAPPRSKS